MLNLSGINGLTRKCCTSGTLVVLMVCTAGYALPVLADDTQTLPEVEVVGVTPVHGVGLPKDKVPTNVQSATSADLERSQNLDLTGFARNNLGSVNINDAQDNPLQPNVLYRGFTSSPLLGTPQGISVYLDGMRFNEAFGDIVNWDLLPESSIASINLISGANPVFGLNTLGGALSIQSKNGFTDPGHSLEAYGGSFGRVVTSLESGANNGTLGYYLNVRYFNEDGWRDASPSNAVNFFTTLSWRHANDSLDLHISHGNTDLIGNGVQPLSVLASDRASIFTSPDQTKNDMTLVNLEGAHWFTDKFQTSGNIYYRTTDTHTANGDTTDFNTNTAVLLDDDGNPVLDQNGNSIPSTFDAVFHQTVTDSETFGGTLQATLLLPLFSHDNQFIAGVGYDRGLSDFNSSTEAATLLADRSTAASGLSIPSVASDAGTTSRTASAYFTDAFSITKDLTLSVSGRYNDTKITLSDSTGDINGSHSFSRFNPAAGLTWQFIPGVNFFGGYSESSRAPTPVELTCSDPTAPCFLPNAFVADPPLKQVVAESFEGGVRGSVFGSVNYTVDVFHTTNIDDILFQCTGGGTCTTGFFANAGDTRRRGFELGLNGVQGKARWFLNYSYVDATFESNFTESSPNHPNAAADSTIQVVSGDRIPGIPKHNVKLGADYALTPSLSIGGDVVYNSDQVLFGDEANQLKPLDGYAVVNLHGNYVINKHITAFASIENLFDTDYETFGILGEPDDVPFPPFSSITDPRMASPGVPFGGWVGLKISL
ncbi:MAG TPA: TonB-dependent receptor [Gammaproteobacteria bacterium]|nr:TonB-dependent receptor [Gammaproteobacteria bacterium]